MEVDGNSTRQRENRKSLSVGLAITNWEQSRPAGVLSMPRRTTQPLATTVYPPEFMPRNCLATLINTTDCIGKPVKTNRQAPRDLYWLKPKLMATTILL